MLTAIDSDVYVSIDIVSVKRENQYPGNQLLGKEFLHQNCGTLHHCPFSKMVKTNPSSRSVIIEIPSENQLDLVWSLQPVLFPLRIVGIDLDVAQPRSKFRFFTFLVLELMVVVLVISSAIGYFDEVFDIPDQVQGSKYWSKILGRGSRLVLVPIFHLFFIPMVIFKKWTKLWKKMDKLYFRFLNYHTNFARKLRKCVYILKGIFLIPVS